MESSAKNHVETQEKPQTSDNSKQEKNPLYWQMDSNRVDTLALSRANPAVAEKFNPSAYSALPPYLLDEMSKRDPNNAELKDTVKQTKELQDAPAPLIRPRVGGHQGEREVYDAKGQFDHPGDKARFEGDAATGNDEVDKAYEFTGIVRDFYQKEFGRNSIDGEGMKMISTVNYGINYQNAYWNGYQMTYGHPSDSSPFKTFMLLDVCGHEITHGVTEHESSMQYYGQAGALNESCSDVFGSLIKQYDKHQTADQADWVIGEGIWKDSIHGKGLRDMLHPGTAYDDPKLGKDPQPANMKDYVKTYKDNGGVHYNSGIPNRAFALFAQAVGGYAWEDPGHIWFAARKAAGGNPSFSQFAYRTIEAAKSLGHADEVEKLQKAWDAVGVTPNADARDTDTPRVVSDIAAGPVMKKAS